MFLKTTSFLSTLTLFATAMTAALPAPSPAPVEVIVEGQDIVVFESIQCGNERRGLKPICPHLNKTEDHGCVRCKYVVRFLVEPANKAWLDVKGFDVTGVVTEVDLTFPEIKGQTRTNLSRLPG